MAGKPIPDGYHTVTPDLTIRYIVTQIKDNAG
jgi:hypothetical protein